VDYYALSLGWWERSTAVYLRRRQNVLQMLLTLIRTITEVGLLTEEKPKPTAKRYICCCIDALWMGLLDSNYLSQATTESISCEEQLLPPATTYPSTAIHFYYLYSANQLLRYQADRIRCGQSASLYMCA